MFANNSTQKEEKCLGREGEERVDVMREEGKENDPAREKKERPERRRES